MGSRYDLNWHKPIDIIQRVVLLAAGLKGRTCVRLHSAISTDNLWFMIVQSLLLVSTSRQISCCFEIP